MVKIILLASGLFRHPSVGFCWKGSFTIIGGVRSERVGELGRSLVWRYNGSFIDSLSGGFRGPALVYSGSRRCPSRRAWNRGSTGRAWPLVMVVFEGFFVDPVLLVPLFGRV